MIFRFRLVANDLSTYSYDALLESYFGVDKYSDVLKEKVTEYEALSSKKELLFGSNGIGLTKQLILLATYLSP